MFICNSDNVSDNDNDNDERITFGRTRALSGYRGVRPVPLKTTFRTVKKLAYLVTLCWIHSKNENAKNCVTVSLFSSFMFK